MYTTIMLALAAASAACGPKKDDPGAGSAAAAPAQVADPPVATAISPGGATSMVAPVSCPAGNVNNEGACVVAVNPRAIASVTGQQTQFDDASRKLDRVDAIAAALAASHKLLRLPAWKTVEPHADRRAALDATATALEPAVAALRAFKPTLRDGSARLARLKTELERIAADRSTSRRIDEPRTAVSTQVRGIVEPLADQIEAAIKDALQPLARHLPELSDAIGAGCARARGAALKPACAKARDALPRAIAATGELRDRLPRLFDDVSSELDANLAPLVDPHTHKRIARMHARIANALDPSATPPPSPAPAAGSATAAGSAAPVLPH